MINIMKTIINPIVKAEIAKKPVVVVSLKQWEEIEAELENLEMMRSKIYRDKIQTARREKKIYSSKEVKKLLKI